ncbi:hypothetical protein Tco_0469258 [Tanacetum coccineum]
MTKSLANSMYLKKKLYTYYISPCMKLDDHIDEFNKLILDLANIDIEIKDEDQALMLLTSFPSSYENFMETLLYGKESLIMEDVLATLISRELKKRTEGTKEETGDGLYARGRSTKERQFNGRSQLCSTRRVRRDQILNSSDDEGNTNLRSLGGIRLYMTELGAQGDREAEVFQVSNDDAVVAQRRLGDKQPEEKTNMDCLVNEQEKVHLGIKMGANITVIRVPSQEGAEGNVVEKKKVKESMEANLGKLLNLFTKVNKARGADEELSDGGSTRVIVYGYDGLPMQPVAPPSPNYVPGPEHRPSPDYVPGLENPPSPAKVPYVREPKGGPRGGSYDYPANGGDGDDEPSDDDDDDDDTDDEDKEPFEDEDDEEEEEEHLAPVDSSDVPAIDPVPLAGDTEAFETDESAPTPRSPQIRISFAQTRLHRVRKTVRLEPPMTPSMEARIAEYAAAPTPPSPLSPWSSPLPQIPSPPLPPPPSSLHLPPPVPTSLPLPSSPLPASLFIPPPVNRREDIPKAGLPPHKRLCLTAPTLRYEVGESSIAAPRPTGGHRVDYGFIGTLDSKTRCQRAEEVGYGIRDV